MNTSTPVGLYLSRIITRIKQAHRLETGSDNDGVHRYVTWQQTDCLEIANFGYSLQTKVSTFK